MSVLASIDPILLDLALLFALCVGVVVVFHRLRVPPIAGFLLTGVAIGPNALGLVGHQELVVQLSEVGVVILLFSVGMELPLRQLAELRRAMLIGGSLQMALTVALGAGAALVGGLPWRAAVFLGLLLAMSSTALATKLLSDRGEMGSPVARFSLAILVAQDLAIVPVILLLPLLAGSEVGALELLQRTAVSFAWLIAAVGAAKVLAPRVLDLVCRTRSREAFVLTVIGLCLLMAVVTGNLGLSLALGAFLAGVVLADSAYHHMAVSEVEPFRDALSSLFFVSMGMLFDPRVLVERPVTVLLALSAVVLGKTLVVLLAARVLAKPPWLGVRAGLLIAQVGEFSFVLVQIAAPDLLPSQWRAVFLAVAVLSIAATPVLYALGTRSRRIAGAGPAASETSVGTAGSARMGHAVVVGYGPAGQVVGRALRALKLPFTVVEMNAATVRMHKENGVDILAGDCKRAAVLQAAGIRNARLLVLLINDAEAARAIASMARSLAPGLRIVARAGYIGEVDALLQAGANEVVPQEMETAIEMMARTLRHFLVPDDEIDQRVRLVRESVPGRRAAAEQRMDPVSVASAVPGLEVRVAAVHPGSEAANKTLASLELRRRTGVTAIAWRSGDEILADVDPARVLQPGDILVLLGPSSRMVDAVDVLRPSRSGAMGCNSRETSQDVRTPQDA